MGAWPKVIAPVALGSSEGDIYTVTAGKTGILREIILCNTDSADRTVNLYLIPSGGSSGVANQIWADTIKSKETRGLPFDTCLAAGDKLRGYASAASVVGCRASATEVS